LSTVGNTSVANRRHPGLVCIAQMPVNATVWGEAPATRQFI